MGFSTERQGALERRTPVHRPKAKEGGGRANTWGSCARQREEMQEAGLAWRPEG